MSNEIGRDPPPLPNNIFEQRLQAFIFLLLRDRLNFGALEDLLSNHLDKAEASGVLRYDFDDQFQADYALKIAQRILLAPRVPGGPRAQTRSRPKRRR